MNFGPAPAQCAFVRLALYIGVRSRGELRTPPWRWLRRPHVGAMFPVTTGLIVANVAMFLLESVAPGPLYPLALWPLGGAPAGAGVGFAPWQLVSYAFLHGSVLHLAFNMFALYMFGGAIERVFGAAAT